MARIIPEEGVRFTDPDTFEAHVAEYAKAKAAVKVLEARIAKLHPLIFDEIDADGETDDKGNIYVELDPPIEGVKRVEKTLRVKTTLNSEVATEIVDSKGLHDEIFRKIEVLDEEELMHAIYNGKLSAEEIDEMFTKDPSYALNLRRS
jgi:hypothetical protein